MTLVIGTDEAGYGPNLGPLVIGATAWKVDAPADEAETILCEAVAELLATKATTKPPVIWRDSKEVFRGGTGRDTLMHSALTAVAVAQSDPAASGLPHTWPALVARLGQIGPDRIDTSLEWQSFTTESLLTDAAQAAIATDAAALKEGLATRGIRLVSLACRCVYPGLFNSLLERGMNKSDILSRETLQLAATLAESWGTTTEPTLIWCDRHGGRKRYSSVIAAAFGTQAAVREETAQRSAYQLTATGLFDGGLFGGPAASETHLEFCVKGERRPPVAVASLTAKLIRELAMERFNAFWCDQDAGLTPTAGYPVDAARWYAAAAASIQRLGIEHSQLWRQV